MKASRYIKTHLNKLNKTILTQLLAEESIELNDQIWNYLKHTTYNTNLAMLKHWGIDITESNDESQGGAVFETAIVGTAIVGTAVVGG